MTHDPARPGASARPAHGGPPAGDPRPANDGSAPHGTRGRRWLVGSATLALLLLWGRPPDEQLAAASRAADTRMQVARFAAIDTTLGVAVAEAQLAALRAQNVALRAFAVQQAARYGELRSELRVLATRLDTVALPHADSSALAQAQQLRALQGASGAHFDREYVRRALALNRELLAELDAALATIEDVELRDALQQVRGTLGATIR